MQGLPRYADVVAVDAESGGGLATRGPESRVSRLQKGAVILFYVGLIAVGVYMLGPLFGAGWKTPF